uniref:Pentatricopeptide repeat-containing protein n=1 Tax=Quercus lobata TaxID=97700 RepID=A0A7N2MHD6_QUELO
MLGFSLPSASKLPLLPSIKPSTRSCQNLPSSSPQNRNFEPLHHRLIHHLNVGHLHKAISTLDLMAQKGTQPDLISHHLLPLPQVLYKVLELPTRQTRSHPLLGSLPTPP